MSRIMTAEERIEARHWLQVLSEYAISLRNAMDIQHGVVNVTDEGFLKDWEQMKHDLDAFSERVKAGKSPIGGFRDRNADSY